MGQGYPDLASSVPWLLIPWFLSKRGRPFFHMKKYFNNLCQISVQEWNELYIQVYVSAAEFKGLIKYIVILVGHEARSLANHQYLVTIKVHVLRYHSTGFTPSPHHCNLALSHLLLHDPNARSREVLELTRVSVVAAKDCWRKLWRTRGQPMVTDRSPGS